MKVIVHHDEIGLKKGNFSFFEKKLVENIRKNCEKNKVNLRDISRENKRILCDFSDKEGKNKIIKSLKEIFGIKYFAFIQETDKKFDSLEKHIKNIYKNLQKQGVKKIAFRTKRSDKSFPLKSPKINEKLGEHAERFNLSFNYSNPEKTIYIEISNKIYVYTEKIECFGGLPVGTSGKVLCLLSGGIDSPIAAWMMMKRGCRVDFLHVHALQKNNEVFEEKNVVLQQIKKLNGFQFSSRFYVLPYSTYTLNVEGKIYEELDLVLFKHYLLKVAERLALEKNYKAIITGDNLAQVASQTLENLNVSEKSVSLPVFRPLIGMNKQEIINLSKQIGLYKTSVKKYKDCCSIISKNPSTKTRLEKFEKELEKIDMDKIVERSFEKIVDKKIDS